MRSTQLETLRALASIEPCTIAELAAKMGKPLSSVRGRVRILREELLLELCDVPGTDRWLLSERGRNVLGVRAEVASP
jgi:DNA-binding transcriptional ArsR family regulator